MSTIEKTEQKAFEYDRNFQEKIMQAMIMDRQWAAQFNEVLDVNFFGFNHLKLVADKYLGYYKEYKEFPSQDLLVTIIRDELKNASDNTLRGQVKDFFIRVEAKTDLGDLKYVKDKSLDFCKKVRLQQALIKAVDYIAVEKYDKVADEIKEALSAGNSHNPGLDLFEDIDARYSTTFRRTIPTGIPELDNPKILNGGLGAGEIGLVVAPSGVGKSHLLVQMGCAALCARKNVIHYTFELNEQLTGKRYDSNLTGIASLDCFDRKEEIKDFYEKNKKDLGRLIVKYYPTGMASCQTLRMHIEKLNARGFVPDLITIDYAGIMRSADRNELLRLELKKVCEEIRGLAAELDIPIWSAIQSNKEGANSDIVDLTNMAESYGQAHVADFVLGLSRKAQQKASGLGSLFVAKNRAGIDGILFPVHLDTARSRISVLTEAEASDMLHNIEQSELNVIRRNIREKFPLPTT